LKKLTIILIYLFSLKVVGQNAYILDNIFNLNLKFKIQQDSLIDLVPIKCPADMLDSTFVQLKDRNINIKKMNIYILKCQYRNHDLETFLYSKYSSDSFLVFLNFYSKHLISYSIYFKSDSLSKNINYLLVNHFGSQVRKLSDNQTNVYFDKHKDPLYSIVVSDTQAMKLMPSWCGNTTRRERRTKSWKKLEKYVLQK
jgi:hypothetical protein